MAGTFYPQPQNENIELTLLSEASSLFMGKLYGIGIARAVAREQLGKERKSPDYNVPGFRTAEYYPDALPNQNGGYDVTPRWDGKMSSSLLGMPVMCALQFVGGDYTDLKGNKVTVPDVIFETVLLSLTMGKNIEKTDMIGGDYGSVKEYIGMKDWQVEVRSIITASAPVNSDIEKRPQIGSYPRENMQAIWQLIKAPLAIPVKCWYLNQFDINYLIIDDGSRVEQVEGEYEMQRLILPCVSDNPLIIAFSD